MEALFKKYFWVLRGVGVAAVVALAASTFTTFFGASYLYVEEDDGGAGSGGESDTDGEEDDEDDKPASAASTSSSRASSRKGRSESDKTKMVTALTGANLFCPSCAPPPPPEPAPGGVVPSVEIDLGAGPPGGIQPGEVRTSLPIKLVVTMESTDARYSQATLLHTETGSVRPYWPGDSISPGVILVAVERGLIHLRNNAQSEYLELGAEVPPPKPKAKPKKEEKKTDENSDAKVPGAEDSIKCDTEDSCTVDRAFVESLFANPMALAKQARVVPSVVDGETKGFKFYGIRSGSLPKLLGLKNGDTLTSVNGNEVKTVDDAMSLVAKLRQASNLSIAIERKGKTITKEISIK